MLAFGSACSADDASPVPSVAPDVTDVGVSSDSESPVDVQAPDSNPGDPGDSSLQDSVSEPDSPGDTAADAIAGDTAADAIADAQVSADADAATTDAEAEVSLPEDTAPPLSDSVDGGSSSQDSVTTADIPPPEPDLVEPDAPEPDTAQPPTDLYLLSVDNSSHTLQKVDVTTGATTDVCQLNTTQTYPSLTFSRFNGLYGSRDGSQLDRIDPCTCAISPIGSYGAYSGIYGITADKSDNLFGVATVQDWLVSISTDTGVGTGLGALGYDFTTSGGTWSDADATLFAINGGTDGLYTVDPILGTATLLSTLDYDFGTVGIELHPGNGVIYACSSAGHLLSVDPNGQVTDIGDMGQGGSCTNLAAPWLQVPCLDGI